MYNQIATWMSTDTKAALNGADSTKPDLNSAYAVYIGLFAPIRSSSIQPLADFVEVLRQHGKDVLYSDEEWIGFFKPFVGNDEDVARDTWDELLCQPAFVNG